MRFTLYLKELHIRTRITTTCNLSISLDDQFVPDGQVDRVGRGQGHGARPQVVPHLHMTPVHRTIFKPIKILSVLLKDMYFFLNCMHSARIAMFDNATCFCVS